MKRLAPIVLLGVVLPAVAADPPRTVTLDVQNMTCASCPLTVRQVLKRQQGVIDAKVDLRGASAEVTFDPAKIRAKQLAKVVSEAGFPSAVRR
jgi:mercuric ion binding protein